MNVPAFAWRIAAETREYRAGDLSGGGAARHPGRWNEAGQRVVYAASSLSLAVLETAAHLNPLGLPLNRFAVRLEIPAAIYANRVELDITRLDPAWSAIPAGRASVEAASAWYRSDSPAILVVPSVIVPEERVVLVNATHPDAARIKSGIQRPFNFATVHRPSP